MQRYYSFCQAEKTLMNFHINMLNDLQRGKILSSYDSYDKMAQLADHLSSISKLEKDDVKTISYNYIANLIRQTKDKYKNGLFPKKYKQTHLRKTWVYPITNNQIWSNNSQSQKSAQEAAIQFLNQ